MAASNFSLLKAARGEYNEQQMDGECQQHGTYQVTVYFEAGNEVGRRGERCPQCLSEERMRSESDARTRQLQEDFIRAKIPMRFLGCELDNFNVDDGNRRQFAVVNDYAQRWPQQRSAGESLLLLGTVGTGKTHLAVSVLKHAIRRGAHGRYATVNEVIREVRATWRGHGDYSERQMIEHFGGVGLLVLDEVGVQYGSDSERVILFDIINERYERVLPTIVCGNVTAEELCKCLDERSVDRLREGGGKAVIFTGKSRRREAE